METGIVTKQIFINGNIVCGGLANKNKHTEPIMHMSGSKKTLIGPFKSRSQLWLESDLKGFMSVKLQF